MIKRIEGVKRSEGIACPIGVEDSGQATLRKQSAYRSFALLRGEIADDCSRLGDNSIIESFLHHPFALQCGLNVPTVPRYDCTLPLTIPNDAKAACALKKKAPQFCCGAIGRDVGLSGSGEVSGRRYFFSLSTTPVAKVYEDFEPCNRAEEANVNKCKLSFCGLESLSEDCFTNVSPKSY